MGIAKHKIPKATKNVSSNHRSTLHCPGCKRDTQHRFVYESKVNLVYECEVCRVRIEFRKRG